MVSNKDPEEIEYVLECCRNTSKTDSVRSQLKLFQPPLGGELRVDVWEPFPNYLYDKTPLTSAVNVVEMWL